jgi:hypothetical protein
MYPDELVLESGNAIRGRILGESLQKIRLATPLGPQEIPRRRIKKVIYATIERGRNADDLLQITGEVETLKREVTTFEKKLIIQLERERAAEQPEEPTPPGDEESAAEPAEDERPENIEEPSAEEEPSERPAPLEDSSTEDGA